MTEIKITSANCYGVGIKRGNGNEDFTGNIYFGLEGLSAAEEIGTLFRAAMESYASNKNNLDNLLKTAKTLNTLISDVEDFILDSRNGIGPDVNRLHNALLAARLNS